MRYMLGVMCCVVLTGCAKTNQPLTPLQREDQEIRMRQFLEDSSPRNQDHQQPKVEPKFSRTFNTEPTSAVKESDASKVQGE